MAPFWPKMVQNWPFWPKMPKNERFLHLSFLQNCALEFPNFCWEPSLWSQKIMTALVFWGNLKNGPFWPKLTQIWPKFCHLGRLSKKIFVKNFEEKKIVQKSRKKKILREKFTFYHSNLPYDLPLPTLRKIFKCLKRRFFAFFFSKKISLVEIWLI